jgi:cytidylate kinase
LKLTDLSAGQVRRLTHQEVTQLASCARASTTTRPEKAAAGGAAPSPGPVKQFTKRRLPPAIAIDGPSSSGKSTVGAEAARKLGYRFCDTGLLYRAVAWLALQRGVPPSDVEALVPLAGQVSLVADGRGRLRHVHADGRDVTAEVAAAEVDRAVSDYAKVPELREALVPRQRALAKGGGIIIAGRDIGTVILPDADVKIYLSASAEERARRRAEQRSTTDTAEADQILAELRRRDAIDSNRETAPLKTAPDAVVINTDGNTFEQTVTAVVDAIRAVTGATSTTGATGAEPAAGGASRGN